MANQFRQTIHDLLAFLPTKHLDALKPLFWSELNYDRSNQSLSTRNWPGTLTPFLAENPIVFATAGMGDAFRIIYIRLKENQFSISKERLIIKQLIEEHPYALFIFSTEDQLIVCSLGMINSVI